MTASHILSAIIQLFIILHLLSIVKYFMKKTGIHDSTNENICAIICEYNPFHNGHLYLMDRAREETSCDGILCLMSGNFVQRGETAILEKHIRAAHAVQGGADCVIELPLPYAVSSAEAFAEGAVSILKKIPSVRTLAFGCENGTAEDFLRTAAFLNEEPEHYRAALKACLDRGESFASAKAAALHECLSETDASLCLTPNNILGLEYTRAILRQSAKIAIHPVLRTGFVHGDTVLHPDFSSASSIRNALLQHGDTETAMGNLPLFTRQDMPKRLTEESIGRLDAAEYFALCMCSEEELASTSGCSEGLEHRLKSLLPLCSTAEEIINQATCRRYPSGRIRRLLLCNALRIPASLPPALRSEGAYCNVLAADAKKADSVLPLLKQGGLPLLIRGKDREDLSGPANECLTLTKRADAFCRSLFSGVPDGYGAVFVSRE